MWSYKNPVKILFGNDQITCLASIINGRQYALVTYSDGAFEDLTKSIIAQVGKPLITVKDIAPNPDRKLLSTQSQRFSDLKELPELIIALGGGSVIDSAKVFSAAAGNFEKVERYLKDGEAELTLSAIPIIAIPTTAGTGSEVTSFATIWDEEHGRKFSLAHDKLYPEIAVVDPVLMLGKPHDLTLATGLDALSHAVESIWNVNANPVSARHAVAAATSILANLPKLLHNLDNLELRHKIAEASLNAGLAFSNTKTAIAHNISYPITINHGVQHGIACSFSLPIVLRSMEGVNQEAESRLQKIFNDTIDNSASKLESILRKLNVPLNLNELQINKNEWDQIIDDAFMGERGKNFLGNIDNFNKAVKVSNFFNS